ncbi:hypothetical protein M9194_15385 [Vibrio sp. S4M6]|uniref:hypothetical protein n=1 Tax=Vibrio sinus TaxID=2946865 RepID=UPI00202AA601|nr:hypothetical protein [Vibrio sinus]MCL9782815.1 hypothetical protein [Vibrio sinus]
MHLDAGQFGFLTYQRLISSNIDMTDLMSCSAFIVTCDTGVFAYHINTGSVGQTVVKDIRNTFRSSSRYQQAESPIPLAAYLFYPATDYGAKNSRRCMKDTERLTRLINEFNPQCSFATFDLKQNESIVMVRTNDIVYSFNPLTTIGFNNPAAILASQSSTTSRNGYQRLSDGSRSRSRSQCPKCQCTIL